MSMNLEALKLTAIVLTAVADLEADGIEAVPQGPLYMGLIERKQLADLDTWYRLLSVLRQVGAVTTTSETISLTPHGRDLARRIDEALGDATPSSNGIN